jgi:ankyrin repeat protein
MSPRSANREILDQLRLLLRKQPAPPMVAERGALSWAKVILGFVATFAATAVGWYFTWTQDLHNKNIHEIEIAKSLDVAKLAGDSGPDVTIALLSSLSDDDLWKRIIVTIPAAKRSEILSRSLYSAIAIRDLKTIERILSLVKPLQFDVDSLKRYPLEAVVAEQDLSLLQFFINHGFKPQYELYAPSNALGLAAELNLPSVIEQLLKSGADIERTNQAAQTPLHRAVLAGNQESVKALLSHGANVNARASDGKTPLISLLSKSNSKTIDRSPFVKALLAHGANANDFWSPSSSSGGQTALAFAVQNNDYSAFTLLLDAGAKQISDFDPFIKTNKSHIAFAVADFVRTDMLGELLRRGMKADIVNEEYGYNLLHYPVAKDPRFVERLLQAGVDPNAIDKEGDRPLVHWYAPVLLAGASANDEWEYMLSIEPRVIQSTELAVKYKADINLSGKFGKTPLCEAASSFSSRSVLRLVELGAKIDAKCGEENKTPIELAVGACRFPSTAVLLSNDTHLTYLNGGVKTLISAVELIADSYKQHQFSFADCDSTIRLLKGEINATDYVTSLKQRIAGTVN